MNFTLPESFELPADVKPGDTFDVVATLVLNEDGTTATLKAVDGAPVEGSDDNPTEEAAETPTSPETDSDFVSAVTRSM